MKIRRTGAVLAVGLLLTVAGCTQIALQEETAFVASEANVSAETATGAGFTHNATEWQNVTRTVEAAGQERELTVSNRASVFVDRNESGAPVAAFAVVSSPQIRVGGQEMSPVGDWSHEEVLTQFAAQFDQFGRLGGVAERDSRQVRMLGTETDAHVFNATLERDNGTSEDVVVSVAKVEHDDDFVVVVGVRGLNGNETATSRADIDALVRAVDH